MPNVKQIYTIVNSLAEQSLGMKGLEATDVSFVSVGNEVLSSDANKDAFYGVLLDRVGKVVFGMRSYNSVNKGIKKDSFEYGAVLQKLYVDIMSATKNTSWNAQSEAASNPFTKSTAEVKQKLFSKISTWEFDCTIPDVQLKTAFISATNMAAFIECIFTAMNNSLELSFENTANICRASFIARKKVKNNAVTYVNLLLNYNTLMNKTLTVASCLTDIDFLTYASEQISLCVNRMGTYSKLFNDEGYARHTPVDMLNVDILANFETAMNMYLRSNTFHEELLKLPNHVVIPYWQGSGQAYAFNDVSKISVQLDGVEGTEVTGVVACLYDKEAIGVTIDNRRTRSIYNPKDEYTNYFGKADMGFYNDMSENGVVFYIAEA